MVRAWLIGLALIAAAANATEWVEVGADTEARYYVDVDSISVDGDNVSVQKRGVYTHVLTDNFGGHPTTFKETIGTIELDCARRINRVTQLDMIGENGEVVWSSGPMKKRMWEDVRPNSHAQSTLEFVCGRLNRI
jgi:surface-adhesin protein E